MERLKILLLLLIFSNNFNNYFSSVGELLADKIHSTPNEFKSFLSAPNINSIFVNPATENEVFNTLLALKGNHSTGIDGLSSRTIKLAVI